MKLIINKIQPHHWVIIIGVLILTIPLFNYLQSQTIQNKNISYIIENEKPDSINQPKVNVKVQKHYDNKGNIIGYDSVYSYSYSYSSSHVDIDSLLSASGFSNHFYSQHIQMDSLINTFFNDAFSVPFSSDFFNNNDMFNLFFNDGYSYTKPNNSVPDTLYKKDDGYLHPLLRNKKQSQNQNSKQRIY